MYITGRAERKGGANTHYRLNDGSIVTRELGVRLEKLGLLKKYRRIRINGTEYLEGIKNDTKKDNIDEQPLIKMIVIEVPECPDVKADSACKPKHPFKIKLTG